MKIFKIIMMIDFNKLRQTQSIALRDFYRYVKRCIKSRSNNELIYSNFDFKVGLCRNISNYIEYEKTKIDIKSEMIQQFIDMNLGIKFPFNNDAKPYYYEVLNDKIYDNSKRIKWINELSI